MLIPAAALPLSLELVELLPLALPVDVGFVSELASAMLESHVYLPWILPSPPWELGASFLKVAHELEISAVETISKAPLTSLRAGRTILRGILARAGNRPKRGRGRREEGGTRHTP